MRENTSANHESIWITSSRVDSSSPANERAETQQKPYKLDKISFWGAVAKGPYAFLISFVCSSGPSAHIQTSELGGVAFQETNRFRMGSEHVLVFLEIVTPLHCTKSPPRLGVWSNSPPYFDTSAAIPPPLPGAFGSLRTSDRAGLSTSLDGTSKTTQPSRSCRQNRASLIVRHLPLWAGLRKTKYLEGTRSIAAQGSSSRNGYPAFAR